MPMPSRLQSRGVVAVTGADRVEFLQGLVSNDVTQARPGHAVWSALLTPQGRYLAEFFILAHGDSLLLDAPTVAVPDLIRRLSRFRLRMKVEIADASDRYAVYAGWDGAPPEAEIAAPDPRLPEAGYRLLAEAPLPEAAEESTYLAHRLRLGLPGHEDMEPDKTLLLEAGFDELHGIAWEKGCYMGQELTARTRYRGLVRRRLVPVAVDGPLPALGAPVLAEGREVGTMRTGLEQRGLAMLRLDALHAPLKSGEALLHPEIPPWMRLPEREEAKPAS
jgi:folate-binding protein YgfZ